MLKEINEIKSILGMDANYFYPAILTGLSGIVPIIISFLKLIEKMYQK